MPRVAGCDPGTSALDVCVLHDGELADQVRFDPAELRKRPDAPVAWLRPRGPFDLIAGPSGYGLPLVRAADCTDGQLALMSLVRPDERAAKGVGGFTKVATSFRDSGLPVVFLPGVVHLPTVPPHRKLNRIDLGTPDKLCVAAMAASQLNPNDTFAVVELGSAFTAVLVVRDGEVCDGRAGTSGPPGWRSGGAWDGELAYLLSPLAKGDLFRGGGTDTPPPLAAPATCDGVREAVCGLRGLYPIADVYLSGSLLNTHPDLARGVADALRPDFGVYHVGALPRAWVKHAAQGAAIVADGLAGGRFEPVVRRLRLTEASGTVLDHVTHPRRAEVRTAFGIGS